MLQRYIAKVKMNAFKQEVGCDQHILLTEVQNSGIIADTEYRRLIAQREILGNTVDKTKFAKIRNFSHIYKKY